MKIQVYDRKTCLKFFSQWKSMKLPTINVPTIAISITSTNDCMPNKQFEEDKINEPNFIDFLCLQFDDVDSDKYGIPISKTDAEKIIEFVQKYRNIAEMIIIHCDAGYSRSPAIAAAISLWLNDTDEYFFKNRYKPNMLVYRTIINEIYMGEK